MARKASDDAAGDERTKSKSAHIRDAAQVVGTRPKDVVAMLGGQGITVSPTLVSNVLTQDKKKKKGKPGRKPGRPAAGANGSAPRAEKSTTDVIERTVSFIEDVGSLAKAKKAIELLERIKGL